MQNLNIVAIDPSLISTALVVNGKLFNYCKEENAYSKTGLTKWYKMCDHLVTYRLIKYHNYKDYSQGEIVKLSDYDVIIDTIITDIKNNINPLYPVNIVMEGYSYSSDAGYLIDLVTFSTLLRYKLMIEFGKDIEIFSPSTLKIESCKLTYPPINVGKKKEKLEYRNKLGIAGGSFTKHAMFLSVVENENLNDSFATHCKEYSDNIMGAKKINKPYEDVVDAYLMYQIQTKRKNNI